MPEAGRAKADYRDSISSSVNRFVQKLASCKLASVTMGAWKRFSCILSLTGLCSVLSGYAGVGSLSEKTVPVRAPSFHLQDLNGKFHRLSDFGGKVLIVNFWATWCIPCRKELPSMNRAWADLKDESVVMLAVNVYEDQEAVMAFGRDYPIGFTVLLDSNGSTSQRWRVNGMPTTFLVNPQSEIVHRMIGKREWDSKALMQLVRSLKD